MSDIEWTVGPKYRRPVQIFMELTKRHHSDAIGHRERGRPAVRETTIARKLGPNRQVLDQPRQVTWCFRPLQGQAPLRKSIRLFQRQS